VQGVAAAVLSGAISGEPLAQMYLKGILYTAIT
jgi:hypothetical protein